MDPELAEQFPRLIGRSTALLAGIALVIWGIWTPRPVPYLAGLVLIVGALWLLLHTLLTLRWERKHPDYPPRQYRRRTTLLAGLVVLGLVLVGVGVPWAARQQAVHSAVQWQTDLPWGQLVPVNGNVHVLSWRNKGPQGNTVSVVDTDDGSIAWGAPGEVYLTHDGGILSVHEDVVSRYDADGTHRWESTIPKNEHETLRVLAERDGHAVIAACGRKGNDRDGDLYCDLSGLDPDGQVTWKRTVEGPGTESSLLQFGEVEAEKYRGPVPAASLVSADDNPVVIDPATGDDIGSIPESGGPSEQEIAMYGDRVLVATSTQESCRLAGYSLTDGSRIWHTDLSCNPGTVLNPAWPNLNTDHGFLTAYERKGAERLLTVDMSDGTVRELSLAELGIVGTEVADAYDELRTATAGDLHLTWNGPEVTASTLTDGEERWQVAVPGQKVERVTAGAETVVIVTAAGSGHNPFLPTDPDDPPEYVTVLQADTGEILSTTLFPRATGRAVVPAPGQVYIQDHEGAALLASQ